MSDIYINQRKEKDDLYKNLQEASLAALQQLAGKAWTDYNAHDPGVTVVEILNYALTELDYRLSFSFEDYLRDEQALLIPEELGLFVRQQVLAPAVVSAEDYRKLIRDAIGGVEDVRVYPVREMSGMYNIALELSPWVRRGEVEEIKESVRNFYYAHRNLCEGLGNVDIIRRKELFLSGIIEMVPGTDATVLLAEIYREAGKYLRTCFKDESVALLFNRIRVLKGVKTVYSLKLSENGEPVERIGVFCSVKIPAARNEVGLSIQVNGEEVMTDVERIAPLVRRYLYSSGHTRQEKQADPCPAGVYRDIYRHDSVQDDFPDCYGINGRGLGQYEPPLRKAQAKQLKAYLTLFDAVFARGLEELRELRQLVSLSGLPSGLPPVPQDTDPARDELEDKEKMKERQARFVLKEKERLADMWDRLYGENSDPAWLREYNYYDDSREQQLWRRVRFLQKAAVWGRDRFRSYNLQRDRSPENIPGVKAYVSALLGWEADEGHPVVNIFPTYNLKLVSDERYYAGPAGTWNHDLLTEELLRSENLERIPLRNRQFTDVDFDSLKMQFPLFHYNLVFEGLFREGIRLENYRIVNIPMHQDRLLVFFHRTRGEWINLGRFSDKEELIVAANCLQCFLVMLNRKSETLYIVEHLYLAPSEPFVLTVVFPGWSARMANGRFRAACEELVCGRLPAHLDVRVRWLEVTDMWLFEKSWRDWRKALAEGMADEAAKVAALIYNVIK